MTVTPIKLAQEHQIEIGRLRGKIQDNVGCIRQLLVGRDVRVRGQSAVRYRVTEVRVSLAGIAQVHGKLMNEGRAKKLGTVAMLEMAP